jgi:hypothetical protein
VNENSRKADTIGWPSDSAVCSQFFRSHVHDLHDVCDTDDWMIRELNSTSRLAVALIQDNQQSYYEDR